MKRLRIVPVALATTLAVVGATQTASAHGRFPQAGQVVVDPSDSGRIFVRTTYGATLTLDGGETWYWLCPETIDFNADKEDPPIVVMSDSSVVAGTFKGLSVSPDFGCDFEHVGGDLAGRFFVDVQPKEGDAGAVAISSNGLGTFAFEVNLWESDDNAATWTHFGTAPPEDFLALSLGIAFSDDDRLYLTGRDGTDDASLEGVLYRSDDRGQTWQRLPVPNTSGPAGTQILPYIGAVTADDADNLYIGVVTTQEDNIVVHFELLHSTDGAQTWTSIFEADDDVSGFALSPDATKVVVGGPKQGLWVAPTDTHAFTKVSELRIGCLTWVESGIYACADQFIDGFTLGVSTDDGETFTPLAELGSPCGPPPECPADSSTAELCIPAWPQEQKELDAQPTCDGGDAAASTGAGAGDPSSGSCSCHVVPTGERESPRDRTAAWFVALLGLGLYGARRRR